MLDVPAPRAGASRRRVHLRGILDLFDLAFLAAALQGHFFLVDGHGVGVRLLTGALEMNISRYSTFSEGFYCIKVMAIDSELTLLSRLLDMLASDSLRLRTLPGLLPTASSSP